MAKQTRGLCKYCGKEYTKGGMLKHLHACKERKKALEAESGKSRCGYYELVICGKYNKKYWLIIEIKETATLRVLDQFIRDIWVECCGHLSAFNINGVNYDAHPVETDFWGTPARSMNYKLKDVISEGMTFEYEYDFGSTTSLSIEVREHRMGIRTKENVTILSRNNPPEILCSICKNNPAKWVNPEGWYEGVPFWCEECLEEEREDDMAEDDYDEEDYYYEDNLLPVCNSPRMGVCGYGGSDKYPEIFEPDKK